MHIQCEWFNDAFNVGLCSKEGKEPFLSIKGCRIVSGKNGPFVSWPAKKLDSGKYWNHVYASEAFNAAVMEAAEASKPRQDTRTHAQRKRGEQEDAPF